MIVGRAGEGKGKEEHSWPSNSGMEKGKATSRGENGVRTMGVRGEGHGLKGEWKESRNKASGKSGVEREGSPQDDSNPPCVLGICP